MIDWLNEALVFDKVYWYLAIPFTVLLLIQLLSTFLGFGGEGGFDSVEESVDIGDDGDFEPGFEIFTVRNFITFFAVFGWSGITFSHSGLGNFATIVLSTMLAIIVLLIVSSLFYFITKLADSGTMNLQRAKGVIGEVYLSIPGNRKGMGKVNITLQGSLRELDAMTDNKKDISTGSIVRVEDVISNSILLVEKINKGEK
ncbi:hypothetical protein RH915_06190 [Serpentinicella sp. ANB-PHB4]|uniref:hypothetical protein n=1 Tax=Serpentinicella sp. ANB-PHB4 TaxID=3074076 RepID=UPI00285DBA5D|nr:hypothetical protein [Serpentinicella sp. ANB-PHB4]MDR5659074.1 hypothetical protein [Serpentinicella sp. ANB-PHB4]